jgi:pyruvate dehydrogenase E2 component (dihydrolipoamide acetyltransferase)
MIGEGGDVSPFESFTLADAGGDKGRLEPALNRMSGASPRVKAAAADKGVPLKDIKGTGKDGRITMEDIEKYKPTSSSGAAAPSATAAASYEDIPISGMRKTIGTRLADSMRTSPHYYVSTTLSVGKLLKLRQSLNSSADGKFKLSVNDFLVKAMAVASRKVPAVNSSWLEKEGVIRQYNGVDVSVAVATKTGLMTPIVKGADILGLEAISSTIKDLGKKAKDGKLKPEQYQGGTITISNMGMNPAVERFTAVINPPQSCILAVGTLKKVAIPAEGDEEGVIWDEQIIVTGSFDHRVVDGAVGAEWIAALKKVVENPLELIL